MIKFLYLDQNAWIELARVYYKHPHSRRIQQVYNDLIKAVSTGKVIVPLSLVHSIETRKNKNLKQRERLAKFMVTLSRGITIRPYTSIIKAEVKSAIFKRVNREYPDIKNRIFLIGISGMFGSKATFVPSTPDAKPLPKHIEKQILEKIDSQEILFKSFLLETEESKKEEMAGEAFFKDTIKKMEDIRNKENKIKDKDARYRVCLARYFIQEICPIMARIGINEKIPKEELGSKLGSSEYLQKFLEDIPSLNVLFNLTYKRDRQTHRDIKENDFWDIASLAIAIPYCDVFITEKMFASLAKESKLDKTYNTKILTLSEIGNLSKLIY